MLVDAGAKKSRIDPPNQTLVPTNVARAIAKNQSRDSQEFRSRTGAGCCASEVTPALLGERFELREVELRIRIHPHNVFVFFERFE